MFYKFETLIIRLFFVQRFSVNNNMEFKKNAFFIFYWWIFKIIKTKMFWVNILSARKPYLMHRTITETMCIVHAPPPDIGPIGSSVSTFTMETIYNFSSIHYAINYTLLIYDVKFFLYNVCFVEALQEPT